MNPRPETQPGDVFQINLAHGRLGWIGAFVLAEEVHSFGITGFVAIVQAHDKQVHAPIRLLWADIDYIGRAVLMPGSMGCD